MVDPHRLPPGAKPRAYRLHLAPDLKAFTFRGSVEIDVELAAAASEIQLHAAELEIQAARAGSTPLQVRLDPARERALLGAPQPLPAGKHTLHLEFTGVLNDKMRGFYRSEFSRPDGSKGVLATTQFESTSARRAFPCFDEPALKATFQVDLTVPEALVALSNMPETSSKAAGPGLRRVSYAPSPVMPTYLLAFVVGEFESVAGATKDGVPVRVFATPGRKDLCAFALETAIRGLEFFDRYYGIPYKSAMPKCDLVGVPDFEFGAMENWGCITFRETALFVDPAKSSVPQRRRVAEVVLHELAHQWFGNLVSPEWWSYLWLNESFATFMAYKAEAALFPDWNVWEEYLAAITSAGKSLDSLRSSHPVEVIVKDPSEVDQIFDAISYNKGGSVLWMLEQHLGEEAFRLGVAAYLKKHAYANAESPDLWSAMGPGVPEMMHAWTHQTGWPVVHARRDGARWELKQERFLLDRDPAAPVQDPTLWDIPVAGTRLRQREGSGEGKGPKLNPGQSGFYLVNYDEAGWDAVAKALPGLGALDRFGVQEDAYSLLRAGYLSVGAYLKLLDGFKADDNHHVWAGVADGLGALADIFSGEPAAAKLEARARGLLGPLAARMGWDEPAGEGHERLLLRATALGASMRFGVEEVVAEIRRRFKDPATLSPNLRSIVYTGAARHGEDSVLDDLVRLYETASLPEVKVQLLRAMGAFKREAPLRRALDYALSDKVRMQDAMYVLTAVPMEVKPAAWRLFQERWPEIDRRYGKSGLLGHWVSAAAAGIPSEAHAKDVEAFFAAHPAPYASEKIKQTLEGIRARAKFRSRNSAALAACFA
jgi:puromycin-sensitive aminopeptidase